MVHPSPTAMKDKRRSRRIVAHIPLQVEPVETPRVAIAVVINLHGALILSPVPHDVGSAIKVMNHRTNTSTRARVVWLGGRTESGLYKLGIEFDAAAPEFWGGDYKL